MPSYIVTGPDGKEYDVDAPEGASEAQIMDYVKRNAAMVPQSKQVPATEFGPKQIPHKGSIFPWSVDERGQGRPDLSAGITGFIGRAITAPGDALAGKFDAMSDEGIGRAAETAALMSPMPAAQRAGERALFGPAATRAASPKIPTAAELHAAKGAAYDAVEKSGVEYSGSAITGMIRDLKADLAKQAIIADNYPKTFRLLDKLDDAPPGSSLQLQFLDALRKELGSIAGGDESRAATLAIKRLDKFVDAADPASLMARAPAPANALPSPAGFPQAADDAAREAARNIRDARGNAAAGFRSDALTGLEESVERRTASTNSGRNLGNNIRSRVASFLDKDKDIRGFSDAELTAMDALTRGTPTTNATRYVGNLLGGGGGLGQTLMAAAGAGAGGALGGGIEGGMVGAAAPAAVGAASRGVYNQLTKRQLAMIDEMVRARSPLFAQRQAQTPMVPVTPEIRAAILRMFAAEQLGAQSQY